MKYLLSILLALPLISGLGLALDADSPALRLDGQQDRVVAESAAQVWVDDGRGTPYVVEKSNNICGLDEPRQLTKPAKVDYEALLDATAEVKKIKKDKIDPNSSEGITLMAKARARVLKACESVRAADGYCSVWKDIKRRDKRAIDDITDAVKRLL